MKTTLEYPMPYWVNKDPEVFNTITMLDISFDTKIHFCKNHDTGYLTILVKVLGFGIRISNEEL